MKTIRNFFALLFIIYSFKNYSQLSGNAFLFGQVNHSGIKVKFIAHPGTAVTDSAFTNSAGTYTINIVGGVYNVVFSKAGFLNFDYNGGTTIVLTNTLTLSNSTLNPGTQVNVNGSITGNWTSNNVYVVTGDITIPLGSTLTIQPGTSIKFNGNYSITANGILNASGNSVSPILFSSNMQTKVAGDWYGILINNSGCSIANCVIEYSNIGLLISNCNPLVMENEFRFFKTIGIYAVNCSSHIYKNWIHDYQSNATTLGIMFDGYSTSIIECNKIEGAAAEYGMKIASGTTIIRNNVINSAYYGIYLCNGSTAHIKNNLIYNGGVGISIGDNISPSSNPLITNNTIYSNSFCGIFLGLYYANATIVNNIICGNPRGIMQVVPSCSPQCSTTPDKVSHNLVWNNATANYKDVQIVGIGQIVTNNLQGNPIDSYFNLSQDPLFIGGSPPNLSLNSPCQNAGDTAYSNNIGYDSVYICNSYPASIQTVSKELVLLKPFPNPSNGIFFLKIEEEIQNAKILIINSTGQIVFGLDISKGENKIITNGLAKGLYNCVLLAHKQVVNYSKLVIE